MFLCCVGTHLCVSSILWNSYSPCQFTPNKSKTRPPRATKDTRSQHRCRQMQFAENHSGTMCDRSRRPPMELDYREFRFPIIYELCTSQTQHLFARTILPDSDREFRLFAMRRRTKRSVRAGWIYGMLLLILPFSGTS